MWVGRVFFCVRLCACACACMRVEMCFCLESCMPLGFRAGWYSGPARHLHIDGEWRGAQGGPRTLDTHGYPWIPYQIPPKDSHPPTST